MCDHLENYYILQRIYHELLLFNNKEKVKTHKISAGVPDITISETANRI